MPPLPDSNGRFPLHRYGALVNADAELNEKAGDLGQRQLTPAARALYCRAYS